MIIILIVQLKKVKPKEASQLAEDTTKKKQIKDRSQAICQESVLITMHDVCFLA